VPHLDLQRDGPEDFEGRVVVWNDCKYVVGAYVGSGQTKFVHQLVNQQSGVCFHVIKVWRSLRQAKEFAEKDDPRRFADLEMIVTTYQVFDHGGAFEVQEYLGPYEDPSTPHRAVMHEADESLKANNPALALELYERILVSNKYHTTALNNRALALQKMGKMDSAFDSIRLALSIEPNHPPYCRGFLNLGLHLGYLRLCRSQFSGWKQRLYLTGQDHLLGIQIYLASGEPSKARELLAEGKKFCKSADFGYAEEAINEALQKKKKADELIAHKVRIGNTSRERDKALVGILRNAVQLYPYDVRNNANLAFTLFRTGAAGDARDILFSLFNVVPSKLVPICLAHAAFCEINLSNVLKAFELLKDAMEVVRSQVTHGLAISPWVVPRPAIWIGNDWKVLQESPESAWEIIDNAIDLAESTRLAIPVEVRQYRELLCEASGRS
jgi:tetratricopeptide (TPR) repeat protein